MNKPVLILCYYVNCYTYIRGVVCRHAYNPASIYPHLPYIEELYAFKELWMDISGFHGIMEQNYRAGGYNFT